MRVVDGPVATNLPMHAKSGRKEVPEIDGLGCRNGLNRSPLDLVSVRIEKDNRTKRLPVGGIAK